MPEITSIIAVKNGEQTILKTIESLLAQTKPIKKIIVVDDASTDTTREIVKSFAKQLNNKIELVSLFPNKWIYKARNYGARHVDTKYLFFLDADDRIDSTYSEKLYHLLEKNPECAFAYTDKLSFRGGHQSITKNPEFDIKILMDHNYIAYASLMKTKEFKAIGGYSEYLNDCRNHLTEWDLWMRFAQSGKIGIHLPEALFHYYESSTQMSRHQERSRRDMYFQATTNLNISQPLDHNQNNIILFCKARDDIDPSSFNANAYTFLAPLENIGNVYCFFYDIESTYFGEANCLAKFLAMIHKISPALIFYIDAPSLFSIQTWAEISKHYFTINLVLNNNLIVDPNSESFYSHFHYIITLNYHHFKYLKNKGIQSTVLSQWAQNSHYFTDFQLKKEFSIIFFGERNKTIEKKLNGLNVACFGKGWPNEFIGLPQKGKMYNKSKIALSFLSNPHNLLEYYKVCFEATASKSMLLCEYTPDIEKYFQIGKEIETFKTKQERDQKIQYFLKNDDKRAIIANKGYERSQKEHTWENRFEDVFNQIKELQTTAL